MRGTLLAKDYLTPLETVEIVEDFHKCVVIKRYDTITEEWRRETVNALRILRTPETAPDRPSAGVLPHTTNSAGCGRRWWGQTMKFIFLDIDGVLNSSRSVVVKIGPTVANSTKVRELAMLDEHDHDENANFEEWLDYGVRFGLATVDPVCVALLNKLLAEAAASDPESVALVLSSTHRKFLWHSKVPYGSDEHLRRLRMYLTAMGVNVPTKFSITPELHKQRGDEIELWINTAYENGTFDDDDRYVVLDDADDMKEFQPLVLCDATQGLSFENYAEACRVLGIKEPGLVLL